MSINNFSVQRKIHDGDIKEFEMLFKRYYEPLCRYAGTFVRDMDVAEEIVEEFFYSYWKNRQNHTIQLSLNAYLYKSIKNSSLRYLQQQAIRQRYASEAKQSFDESEYHTAQEDIEAEELNLLIDKTLQQLPPRCAQVFSLSRFEGKKYQESAELLSISVKTVEADMGKALQLFRDNFKRHNRVTL